MRRYQMIRNAIISFCILLLMGCKTVDAANKPLLTLSLTEIFEKGLVRDLAHEAAKGNVKNIDKLIAKGVDVNAVGESGLPILYWALHELSFDGFVALLERGANPNHQWRTGSSVMSWAARLDDSKFLMAALEHGGDANLRDPSGKTTPLFNAVSESGEGNIEILLQASADINAQDGMGSTPAIKAANLNRYDLVLKLLKHNADHKLKNNWGVTLVDRMEDIRVTIDLESEEFKWRLKVIDYLREKGVEVNPKIPK